MTTSPKISIIIPVYNSEKYLRQCLDSVLAQTYSDFEVLLINDGSKDNSGKICDEYAAKDTRFTVFHKENGGVSAARNLGIQNAKGDWITFVDSDDVLGENYFCALDYGTSADWILINVHRLMNEEERVHLNFEEETLLRADFLMKYYLYPHFPAPWAKFFRRDIIISKNVQFDSTLSFGEDALYNLDYLQYCETISLTPCSHYIYRDVQSGLSKRKLTFDESTRFFELCKIKTEHLLAPDLKLHLPAHLKTPFSITLNSIYDDIKSAKNETFITSFIEDNRNIALMVYNNPKGFGKVVRTLIYLRTYSLLHLLFLFLFKKIKRKNV